MRPETEPYSEVALFVGNLPGQVRGPKAKLLPHPERTNYAVRLIREASYGLPWALSIAELSSRALPAWRSHLRITLSRGAANDVLAGGALTIGNALAWQELRCVDALGLHFRIPRRVRRITMPVRLLVDEDGAAFAYIAAHVPTGRAASKATRRRICDAIDAYVLRCHRAGLPVAVGGDFNGTELSVPRLMASGDVQRLYGLGMMRKPWSNGRIAGAAGKVTDHPAGILRVVAKVPIAPKGRPLALPSVGVTL